MLSPAQNHFVEILLAHIHVAETMQLLLERWADKPQWPQHILQGYEHNHQLPKHHFYFPIPADDGKYLRNAAEIQHKLSDQLLTGWRWQLRRGHSPYCVYR